MFAPILNKAVTPHHDEPSCFKALRGIWGDAVRGKDEPARI